LFSLFFILVKFYTLDDAVCFVLRKIDVAGNTPKDILQNATEVGITAANDVSAVK
jgi:hypothetical protein